MANVRMDTAIGDLRQAHMRFEWCSETTGVVLTRPRRCRRPLPFLALLKLSRMFSFLWNCLFLMDTSILTMSCHTTRPAPMFRWLIGWRQSRIQSRFRPRNAFPFTHPTSELPMSPSLRPTATPCACRVR